MQRELRIYLVDIVEQCDDIAGFTAGLSFQDYLAAKEKRRAVERAFIILGEALVCAARLTPNLDNVLPNARNVIAFRNVLVHNYSGVDEANVWAIVTEHVPPLRREADRWLSDLDTASE